MASCRAYAADASYWRVAGGIKQAGVRYVERRPKPPATARPSTGRLLSVVRHSLAGWFAQRAQDVTGRDPPPAALADHLR